MCVCVSVQAHRVFLLTSHLIAQDKLVVIVDELAADAQFVLHHYAAWALMHEW